MKKAAYKWVKWIGIILLIPSIILNIFLLKKKSSDESILVLEVLDGDTLLLDGKVRLRLRHVDAPELGFCGSQEAKNLLEELVKGKKIVIQEKILDQKARPLALVYVDDKLINLEMIKSGWGRFHHDKSSKTEVLKKAGNEAKEKRIGVYNEKCYQQDVNLENPDCIIKGNIDKNKYVDNKKYYFPGCSQYKFTIVEKDLGEDWFCTEKEAQEAGFVKAETCP
jgi:micrococcal nuclease